jgi:hypothetical protein
MLENDISNALSKSETDKVRIYDLVKSIHPEIKRNQIREAVVTSFLPLLRKMEENKEITLSWNATKDYPIYITRNRKDDSQLWMREVEEIVKDFSFAKSKEKIKKFDRNDTIKDKVIRFNKLFEEKSGEIVPPGDWQKVFMIFMENNIDNENVWVACVEAFKAGVLWNTYRDQLENGNQKTKE